MVTIKQLAEEIGVSKTAVRKKIANLGLKTKMQTNGNQFAIDDETANRIKSAFAKTKTANREPQTANQKTETVSDMVSDLVSVLERELAAKNAQIETLQKLLDQEQQLNAVNQQKIALLEQRAEEPQKKRRWFRKND